jgi:two-component system chemotaxis response regulator CheB
VIKVLVVDDSALMRKLLGGIFSAETDIETAFARNGLEALEQLVAFKPDVVTLDIHMPGLDGLACLDRIMVERPCPVVMVSSLTAEGAETTLEALRLGAVDFVTKPAGAVSLHIEEMAPLLVEKVRAAAGARLRPSLRLRDRIRHRTGHVAKRPQPSPGSPPSTAPAPGSPSLLGAGLVLVGTSTGGPPALEALLAPLPADFPWPILIAQHMPATFTGPLARRLDGLTAIEVVEVSRPTPLEPGVAYVGRGDGDLIVSRRPAGLVAMAAPSQAGYPWHPSTDRLVRSAMEHVPPSRLVGILMTGMGSDGAAAMAQMRAEGGRTIAEAQETAVVWGMPGELVRLSGADHVLPLPAITERLLAWVQ